MITIVLDAGHGHYTPGKRCLKSIDPNQTREWDLNSRIASKVQEKLSRYSGVQAVRVDDVTGKIDVSLKERTNMANKLNADIYCSFHHDAGANGSSAGGLTVFTYDDRPDLVNLRDNLYSYLMKHGGLTGRSNPKRSEDFHVLRETKMSAVLVEHGFMDSTKDTPIILTDEYAEKMAEGWTEFLVNRFSLKALGNDEAEMSGVDPTITNPEESKDVSTDSFLVKVTVSALYIREDPGTQSRALGVIRDQGVYTIVEVKKHGEVEWGKLKSGAGWISLKYTKRVEK